MNSPTETGRAALAEIRANLSMPSKNAMAWGDLTRGERRTLVSAAGLKQSLSGLRWEALTGNQQQAIIDAMVRAASWANGLGFRAAVL